MCGIWGWNGKDVNDFSKDKFNMLGIANQVRGKDSCGLAINGVIFKGHDKNSVYQDFVKNNYKRDEVYKPDSVKSVIGHTRKASHGVINRANAHPFGFGVNGKKYAFYGVHNGTLHNKSEIAKKYDVEISVEKDNTTRWKIDSEILLECIYKSGNFKVLSDYVGGAAIAFVNTKTPTKLYLFKGASKKFSTSSEGEEERPLHVYVESKDSIYFSSEKVPLFFIGGTDDTVIDLKPNIVYEIQNGNFEKAIQHKVSRAKSAQYSNFSRTTSRVSNYSGRSFPESRSRGSEWDDEWDAYDAIQNAYGYANSRIPVKTYKPTASTKEENDRETLILEKDFESIIPNGIGIEKRSLKKQEKLLETEVFRNFPEVDEGILEMRNDLRFYSDEDTLAQGIYCYIPNVGFYFLSHTDSRCDYSYSKLQGMYYKDGKFVAQPTNATIDTYTIPFPSRSALENNRKYFYFRDGVMYKTLLDYKVAGTLEQNNELSVSRMSFMSVFPVGELEKTEDIESYIYYLEGNPVTGKAIAPGGNRKIYLNKGFIKAVKIPKNGKLLSYYSASAFPDSELSNLKVKEGKYNNSDDLEQSKHLEGPKKEDKVITAKECDRILKEHEEMAKQKATGAMKELVLATDLVSSGLEDYKDTEVGKHVLEVLSDIEATLYDEISKMEK